MSLARAPDIRQQWGPQVRSNRPRAGRSLEGHASAPSGGIVRLDDVLKVTDAIVRGRVGAAKRYLSKDQRDVYTDYTIVAPVILYEATLSLAGKSAVSRPTTVTVRRGSVTVNDLTYTVRYPILRSLEPGGEYLFLLRWIEGQYRVAGQYYGVLWIENDRVAPTAADDSFANEPNGVPASEAIEQIVTRRNAPRSVGLATNGSAASTCAVTFRGPPIRKP